jgi:hypothetical protein
MIASTLSVAGLIVAAIAFVVLYVIIGVPLWVSLVVAAVALAGTALITGGTAARQESTGHRQFG